MSGLNQRLSGKCHINAIHIQPSSFKCDTKIHWTSQSYTHNVTQVSARPMMTDTFTLCKDGLALDPTATSAWANKSNIYPWILTITMTGVQIPVNNNGTVDCFPPTKLNGGMCKPHTTKKFDTTEKPILNMIGSDTHYRRPTYIGWWDGMAVFRTAGALQPVNYKKLDKDCSPHTWTSWSCVDINRHLCMVTNSALCPLKAIDHCGWGYQSSDHPRPLLSPTFLDSQQQYLWKFGNRSQNSCLSSFLSISPLLSCKIRKAPQYQTAHTCTQSQFTEFLPGQLRLASVRNKFCDDNSIDRLLALLLSTCVDVNSRLKIHIAHSHKTSVQHWVCWIARK